MAFRTPKLNYAYDALEPHIDAHYDGNSSHQTSPGICNKSQQMQSPEQTRRKWALKRICKNISNFRCLCATTVAVITITVYSGPLWKRRRGAPFKVLLLKRSTLLLEILMNWKTKFNNAGTTRFGSGWAWLTVGADKKLTISSTPNQDNPLMDIADVKNTGTCTGCMGTCLLPQLPKPSSGLHECMVECRCQLG